MNTIPICLELYDFISHPHTVIELDDITSLVGQSNSGKTNILRALEMVMTNGNFPVGWIRWGAESARVRLTFSNGTWVERQRTTTSQTTIVFDGSEEKRLAGKKEAADLVLSITGVRLIEIDPGVFENVNFIHVNSAPFLLSGRSDVLYRRLVSLAGNYEIQATKTNIASRLRRDQTILESTEQNHIETIESYRTEAERDQRAFDLLSELRGELMVRVGIENLRTERSERNQLDSTLHTFRELLDQYRIARDVLEVIELNPVRLGRKLATDTERLRFLFELKSTIDTRDRITEVLTERKRIEQAKLQKAVQQDLLSDARGDLLSRQVVSCPKCGTEIPI